jgi:hypothetical protein
LCFLGSQVLRKLAGWGLGFGWEVLAIVDAGGASVTADFHQEGFWVDQQGPLGFRVQLE